MSQPRQRIGALKFSKQADRFSFSQSMMLRKRMLFKSRAAVGISESSLADARR
jgi:hypothetical protein